MGVLFNKCEKQLIACSAGSAHDRFDISDMERLLEKAYDYGNWTMSCKYIYRDKYDDYWDNIINGTLPAYPKDDNGDPKNPLKGIKDVKGIFFSTKVWSGQPRTPALFGDRRLVVPFEDLYNDEFNVYFNDFYCMTKGGPHYVTLIICAPDSKEDNICAGCLVKLDISNNPFLSIKANSCYMSGNIFVEIFHTAESIRTVVDLPHKIEKVECQYPKPGLKLDGRHKKPDCTVCNI